MSEVIKTAEPKHKPEVLSALEKTLASHNLRLKPGESLEGIVDGLAANRSEHRRKIRISQCHHAKPVGAESPVHVSEVIEGFAQRASAVLPS